MELYSNKDLKLVEENIDTIVNDIEIVRKQFFPRPGDNIGEETKDITDAENIDKTDIDTDSNNTITTTYVTVPANIPPQPPLEIVFEIVKITLEFVMKKKRKIYGGYAQNAIIKEKNKNDAFYSDNDIPDIDVYSPNPIEDIVELCNLLYSKGYKNVIGKEAMHKETYKIFTNGYNAIDLSYVPKLIYDNIPFVEINNIRYVHPSFAMIDLYKMMSEPLFSSWRWKKIFNRLYLLQKYYPFEKFNEKLQPVYKHKKNVSDAMKIIEQFINNNKNIYLFGNFAYNYFVRETKMKEFNEINIDIYQFVSTNYKTDCAELIKNLKKKGLNISYVEYYPFWTLTGRSVEISCDGEIIAKIYNSLKRCCPIITILNDSNIVQIGSFDYILLMEMIMVFKQKVVRDIDKHKYHLTIISNLLIMREYYLKKNNMTLFDNSPYQSFIKTCIGETFDPVMEAKRQRQRRKESNSYSFIYKPIRELKSIWQFSNTSGNKIKSPKNLKIRI